MKKAQARHSLLANSLFSSILVRLDHGELLRKQVSSSEFPEFYEKV